MPVDGDDLRISGRGFRALLIQSIKWFRFSTKGQTPRRIVIPDFKEIDGIKIEYEEVVPDEPEGTSTSVPKE